MTADAAPPPAGWQNHKRQRKFVRRCASGTREIIRAASWAAKGRAHIRLTRRIEHAGAGRAQLGMAAGLLVGMRPAHVLLLALDHPAAHQGVPRGGAGQWLASHVLQPGRWGVRHSRPCRPLPRAAKAAPLATKLCSTGKDISPLAGPGRCSVCTGGEGGLTSGRNHTGLCIIGGGGLWWVETVRVVALANRGRARAHTHTHTHRTTNY